MYRDLQKGNPIEADQIIGDLLALRNTLTSRLLYWRQPISSYRSTRAGYPNHLPRGISVIRDVNTQIFRDFENRFARGRFGSGRAACFQTIRR